MTSSRKSDEQNVINPGSIRSEGETVEDTQLAERTQYPGEAVIRDAEGQLYVGASPAGERVTAEDARPKELRASDGKIRQAYLGTSKDLPLKVLAAHLFGSMGYVSLVETGIEAYTYGKTFRRQQVSDIDVYAIRFDQDLSVSSVAVECKSAEGNAIDHILKLDGICRLMGARYGVLIQKSIPSNAREVAARLGHTTWDESELNFMLTALGVSRAGLVEELIEVFIQKKELRKRAAADFPRLCRFIYADYWMNEVFRSIQTIVAGVSQMNGFFRENDPAHALLIDEAALLFSIAVLRSAGRIMRNHITDRSESVKDVFFGGTKERREREILFDRIQQQVGVKSSFLPPYFDAFAELVLRFVAAPAAARRVPNIWLHIIDKRLTNDDGWEQGMEEHDAVSFKLVKDVLRFLVKLLRSTPLHWCRVLEL